MRSAAVRRATWAAAAALMATLPAVSQALNITAEPAANLDLSKLGQVGFVGDFSGISLYQYAGQTEDSLTTNGTQGVLTQLPNGVFVTLVLADADIETMCPFVMKDGTLAGIVVGGNFTSFDGVESTAVAMFNPTTTEISPLPGVSGEVSALLCDQDTNTVYVGGNFHAANSTNAIAWVGTDGWTNLPFEGFNGPVTSITKAADGNIVFGGSFTGLGNASTPTPSDGQIINLSTANITAGPSSSTAGFGDPTSVVCPSNSTADGAGTTWLLADDAGGFWRADFGFGFEPTKLRLWNTHEAGRGTQTFRFTAFPINGIMNLSYVDPDSGKTQYCTSECSLSNSADVQYQDFHFVNRVGMNSFQIDISAWYGSGAGFNGVELFEDDIFSYAIAAFNEPTCAGLSTTSSSSTTGAWSSTPSYQSTSEYLSTNVSSDSDLPSVVFLPDIRTSGNYSVNMYTPGCQQDGTCATRGMINITATMSAGKSFETIIYQSNDFDKYDQIYFGFVDAVSSSFRPSVTITPVTDHFDGQTVVAQRVGFTLISGAGGLNGLFELDPNQATFDAADISNSTIDKAGTDLSTNAQIFALASSDKSVYVGGNFSTASMTNILRIDDSGATTLAHGGLNGEVRVMYLNGTMLYVAGSFSDVHSSSVKGLGNIAAYDTASDAWSPLGAGVNGPVYSAVPVYLNITTNTPTLTIAFTGSFDEIAAFDNNSAASVSGFAVWVPSEGNWLNNLNASTVSLTGQLSSVATADGTTFYAGNVASQSLAVNGAASLISDEALSTFPVDLLTDSSASSSSVNGVATGLFYNENDLNITILGGHFAATATNGSAIHNLLFVNGSDSNTVTGISSAVSSNSSFLALAVQSNILYAGGLLEGSIGDSPIGGLVSYNLVTAEYTTQPPALSGADETVYVISVQESSGDVYVGGSFESAGSLNCPAVCVFTTSASQWNRAGTAITGGAAHAMLWKSSDSLIVGGTLLINNNNVSLATYDTKKLSWTPFDGQSSIPGPVSSLVAANSDSSQLWVAGTSSNGSDFLMKYDGSVWHSVAGLGAGSTIRGVQVLSLTESHDDSDLVDSNQVLMLLGQINLPGFGNASAVLYDGTAFHPYALSTTSAATSGSIAQFFSQKQDYFTSSGGHMALGFVVLIGLAISLGLTFLIVVAGIIAARVRRSREGYVKAPTNMFEKNNMLERLPPEHLLGTINQGRSAPAI